jgi:hypothetical protein
MQKKYTDAVIEYVPVKYEMDVNATSQSAFFPSRYTTQPYVHKANLTV